MVVHEWGHLYAARRFGMRVTRFSIGFGPTLFQLVPEEGSYFLQALGGRLRMRVGSHDPLKHDATIYQVALIPFLAYVQIAGMNPLEPVDPQDKGSYANARLFPRVVAIAGGPLANYLFASVLFFAAFAGWGKMHVDPNSTIVSVVPGRPAEAADMKSGDKITKVAGTPVDSWKAMASEISSRPGQTVPIEVVRDGSTVVLSVRPADEGGAGRIGVGPLVNRKGVSFTEAATLAVTTPPKIVVELVTGIAMMITGKADAELGGPVRIVKEGASAADRGWPDWFEFMGLLSAYLGAFNLMPLPALDGGRLIFLGYEGLLRRKPNPSFEAHIHAVGIVMLLGLMVWVTIFKDFGVGLGK